ncbi:MAG: cysteine desulfurase [Ruminococcaceae bacterium]|nr:cysteine desulfurase [Oscillospiraceae bacterium]
MIYLDNAATTKVSDAAANKAFEIMTKTFGNPSSVHDFGYESEKVLKSARKAILSHLGSIRRDDELVFTSGGTEANNLAVFGALAAKKHGGKTVFFSDSEHASVYNISKKLEKDGYNVKYIATKGGKIDFDYCEKEFSKDTVLISCMYANNETGTIYDIKKLDTLRKKLCPQAVLHTDAVQAFGKTKENLCSCGADLISVSGHKIHAPKGIGALYIKSGVRILPILIGGGQEKDIRPGTEALPSIAAFEVAANEVFNLKNILKVEKLNSYLTEKLEAQLPQIKINKPENSLPYVVSLSLPAIKSEVMLRFLSAKGIYISAGSACTSKHRENRVLSAFGLDSKSADCTIRVSFCEDNTFEEIDTFLKELENGINSLISLK